MPGGTDGPGGVLVCSEDFITYKNQGVPERRCPIPKREGYGDRPILIVSFATHKQKVGPWKERREEKRRGRGKRRREEKRRERKKKEKG